MADQSGARVCVGIPVYNGERFIRYTLDSIGAQTYDDYDVVICDNASTDGTLEICRSYAEQDPRIRIIQNEQNVGLVRNYRRVIDHARGTYFKMIAADDLMEPTYLDRCVEVLDDTPEAVLCTARMAPIDEHGQTLATRDAPNLYVTDYGENYDVIDPSDTLLRGSPPARFGEVVQNVTGNLMVQFSFGLTRLHVLRAQPALGLYIGAEKVALAQLCLAGEWRFVPETLMRRRLHSGHFAFQDMRRTVVGLDPRWSGRIPFPAGRQLLGYFQTIRDAPIAAGQKAQCAAVVARHVANVDRLRRLLPGEYSYIGYRDRSQKREAADDASTLER